MPASDGEDFEDFVAPRQRGRLIDESTILLPTGERIATFHGCDREYLRSWGIEVGDFVSFSWVLGHRDAEAIERIEPTPEERAALPMPEPAPVRSPLENVDAARFEEFLRKHGGSDRPGSSSAFDAFLDEWSRPVAEGSAAESWARDAVRAFRSEPGPPQGETPEETARFEALHDEGNRLIVFEEDWRAAFDVYMRALQIRPACPRTLRRLEQLKTKLGKA